MKNKIDASWILGRVLGQIIMVLDSWEYQFARMFPDHFEWGVHLILRDKAQEIAYFDDFAPRWDDDEA